MYYYNFNFDILMAIKINFNFHNNILIQYLNARIRQANDFILRDLKVFGKIKYAYTPLYSRRQSQPTDNFLSI